MDVEILAQFWMNCYYDNGIFSTRPVHRSNMTTSCELGCSTDKDFFVFVVRGGILETPQMEEDLVSDL